MNAKETEQKLVQSAEDMNEENLIKIVERFLVNNGTVGTKRQDWPDKLKKEKLTAKARFKEDLGMDSLDTVELLLQIEEEYDVRLEVSEFKDFKTLGDAVEHFLKTRTEMFEERKKAQAKVNKINKEEASGKKTKRTSSRAPKKSKPRG